MWQKGKKAKQVKIAIQYEESPGESRKIKKILRQGKRIETEEGIIK